MRLLHRSSPRGVVADLIIGVGLVGSSVADASRRLPGSLLSDQILESVRWSEPSALARALEEATIRLRALTPAPARVRLFWCAGKAGFAASQVECDGELRTFREVLRWAERERLAADVEFHLTSSAGGLHEGQLLVSPATPVRTPRPYAALKWAQEQALEASSLAARFIYRLSSVYDLPTKGRRLGLISTLVLNALRRRSTLITAHASTQRDFVAASDVATYMTMEARAPIGGAIYLVSGRPLSVWSLQLAVEQHLLRPVAVTYSTGKENFESTTFLPSMRPQAWSPSSVQANLMKIVGAAQVYSA